MRHDISKKTEITASKGMSDFEVMATPLTNINTPKKIIAPVAKTISPVAKTIKKLTDRGSSDLRIVDHLLEKGELIKPATPEIIFKESCVKVTRQKTMFTVTPQPIKTGFTTREQ